MKVKQIILPHQTLSDKKEFMKFITMLRPIPFYRRWKNDAHWIIRPSVKSFKGVTPLVYAFIVFEGQAIWSDTEINKTCNRENCVNPWHYDTSIHHMKRRRPRIKYGLNEEGQPIKIRYKSETITIEITDQEKEKFLANVSFTEQHAFYTKTYQPKAAGKNYRPHRLLYIINHGKLKPGEYLRKTCQENDCISPNCHTVYRKNEFPASKLKGVGYF